MISLFSHDIILVLFQWIIKQDYKNKYLVTGNWSQSTLKLKNYLWKTVVGVCMSTSECRTQHPPGQNTPCSFWHRWTKHPSCFLQGGHNTPCNLWKGGQNPPRKFCKVDKIPPIMWTKPPSDRILCVYYCYRILVPWVIICLQWYSRQNPFQEMNINVCLSTIFLFQKCMRAWSMKKLMGLLSIK